MVSSNKAILDPNIRVTKDGNDIPSDETLENDRHRLVATVDKSNGDIYLKFSSRLALYDFARNLVREAIFGETDSLELYPLSYENKLQIVNGVRLSLDSSRIFIGYPCQTQKSRHS